MQQKYIKNDKEYIRKKREVIYTTNLNIKIDEERLQKLNSKCKKDNVKVSKKVRELIDTYIEE